MNLHSLKKAEDKSMAFLQLLFLNTVNFTKRKPWLKVQ